MKAGDFIETPRFLMVKIKDVLTPEQARKQGFTEPTHYKDSRYKILGKNLGDNRMAFVAVILDREDSILHGS